MGFNPRSLGLSKEAPRGDAPGQTPQKSRCIRHPSRDNSSPELDPPGEISSLNSSFRLEPVHKYRIAALIRVEIALNRHGHQTCNTAPPVVAPTTSRNPILTTPDWPAPHPSLFLTRADVHSSWVHSTDWEGFSLSASLPSNTAALATRHQSNATARETAGEAAGRLYRRVGAEASDCELTHPHRRQSPLTNISPGLRFGDSASGVE